MGCPSSVNIGENLVFSITTHDPETGILTDADSAPSYRIYEDETATPILTGSMAKLDDAGTTGFYTELIACTTANGFEYGKTYSIYIQATVDGNTGGISYGFKAGSVTQDAETIWANPTRTLTQTAAQVAAALEGSSITIRRGDTVSLSLTGLGSIAARTKLWFTVKARAGDTDDEAVLQILASEPAAGGDGLQVINGEEAETPGNASITVDDEDDGDITIQIAAEETANLTLDDLSYDVQMKTADGITTLTVGEFKVVYDFTRATS
jgi:hypothetical protein